MPSPVGHALAGLAVAWAGERLVSEPPATPRSSGRLALVCAFLAALPDADLLYMPIHRTLTHSFMATAVVTIIAMVVTGWVTRRARSAWYVGLVCGAAYGSHVLFDWLGDDASRPYGIQALWPFSEQWFMSQWSLFPGTERHDPLSLRAIRINLIALATELAVLGPPVAVLAVRRRRASARTRGFPSPTASQDPRPQPSGGAEDTAGI